MKIIALLIIFGLFLGSLNFLIQQKRRKVVKQAVSLKKRTKNIGPGILVISNLGYPQEILKELNLYRQKQRYSPVIQWQEQLAQTARQEAAQMVNRNTFGEHVNFMTWKGKHLNKYFTELALEANTRGRLPPKRIFAKTVLQALKQEQEWYLIHEYTHAGVAIVPKKNKKVYYIIIHLARAPTEFRSCKDALEFGIKKPAIDIIKQDGTKTQVKCDQSHGGGWTLVLDMGQHKLGVVNQPIDDLGMKYTQLYFRAKNGYLMDYAKGHPDWMFRGYCFPLNGFQFDNRWYMGQEAPTHGEGENRGQIPTVLYNMRDTNVVQVIKGTDTCKFGNQNKPEFCATEFILKKLPPGQLKAISDVESLLNKWTGDNEWNQQYEVFVR